MTLLLNRRAVKHPHFRWHDSGDIQSVAHLRHICEVAIGTPGMLHWLPTREHAMVKQFLREGGTVPRNMVIRLSAIMVGQVTKRLAPGVLTSSVTAGKGRPCPAKSQGNKCGPCRACWNRRIHNIDYAKE